MNSRFENSEAASLLLHVGQLEAETWNKKMIFQDCYRWKFVVLEKTVPGFGDLLSQSMTETNRLSAVVESAALQS